MCYFFDNTNSCLDNSEEIGLSAQYAVAIDANSGLVLYNKNMDERMYPASMTKVMTAIVALDMIENLDKTTVITQSDIDTVGKLALLQQF